MIEKGAGGGNTITGLKFEKETNILELLKTKKGYKSKKTAYSSYCLNDFCLE